MGIELVGATVEIVGSDRVYRVIQLPAHEPLDVEAAICHAERVIWISHDLSGERRDLAVARATLEIRDRLEEAGLLENPDDGRESDYIA